MPVIQDSSFLIERAGKVVSAIVVASQYKGFPLIIYVGTHPALVQQGLANHLIRMSITSLFKDGYSKLFLIVTKENRAAFHLYQKLGFRVIQGDWDAISFQYHRSLDHN